MKFKLKIISILIILGGFSINGYSQSACKGFGRSMCKVDFEDYVRNPQVLNAELSSGEAAEVNMVFSNAHDYRVYVCAEEHMGEVGIKFKTSKGEVLFDNKDFEMTDTYDFSMTSTRRLVIEIAFQGASGGDDGFAETGCASILVGYKHSTQSGFR